MDTFQREMPCWVLLYSHQDSGNISGVWSLVCQCEHTHSTVVSHRKLQ